MDAADERALSKGDRPVSESLEEAGGDVAEAARRREREAIIADEEANASKLRPATYMASVDLLGRVIKNSDFTDYDVKGPAAKLVFNSWVRLYLIMNDEVTGLLGKMREAAESRGEAIRDKDHQAALYMMQKLIFDLVSSTINDEMASPSMMTVLEAIEEEDISTAERMLLVFMLEDISHPTWEAFWRKVINAKGSSGFVLECFIERMWSIVNSKFLPDGDSAKLHRVVDEVEGLLGWSNQQKGQVLSDLQQAITHTNYRDLQP